MPRNLARHLLYCSSVDVDGGVSLASSPPEVYIRKLNFPMVPECLLLNCRELKLKKKWIQQMRICLRSFTKV